VERVPAILGARSTALAAGFATLPRRLHELGKRTPRRARVEKRHSRPPNPAAWLVVDQANAGCSQAFELGFYVVDLIRDVMETRALPREVPTHGAFPRQRPKQLDVALADIEKYPFDALLGHRFSVHDREANRVTIEGQRGLQIVDGHPDVINAPQHG
jgi:hypothetical protein